MVAANKKHPSYENIPKSYLEEYKTYIWLRPEEIYENKYDIFVNKLDPQDINQGSLASCYFLCALMGLCEYEDSVKKLFITKEPNSKGAYAVNLLIQGEDYIITIDDHFPCKPKGKTPAFSTSKLNEIWVLILEKAWAKINGNCYMKTWLGTPHEALTSICEAPCIYEYHKKYVSKGKYDYIWEKITEALKK